MSRLQAVIFDLDGVITDTASMHCKAWKWAFDQVLTEQLGQGNFCAFSLKDYHDYVDGNPRYVGVQQFLESRQVSLPMGDDDDVSWKTVIGIGNSKNRHFTELLLSQPVDVFEDSLQLIRAIRGTGVKSAVASSSVNCRPILEKAHLIDAFDVIHDGLSIRQFGLRGKPSPDIFIRAMADVQADPRHCVIIEDAISGVQAAVASGAGLVVGLDRKMIGLEKHGAHLVVETLRGLTLAKFGELL